MKTILRVRTGSHSHGTNMQNSDTDIRGVAIPDIHNFFGIKDFQQFEDKEEDIVIYGIKKFISLAVKGNLSILNILFVDAKDVFEKDEYGQRLLDFRENFLSFNVVNSILGYCKSQIHKMNVGRGRCGDRSELIEKYGYDTKFAYHAVMITNMAVELMKTNTYHVLRPHLEQKYLKAIRVGEISYTEAMEKIKNNLLVVNTLEPICKIRKEPDNELVSQFCVDLLKDYFKSKLWEAKE